MNEKNRSFFGRKTIKWISAMVCSASAVALICMMGMLAVALGGGFHGLSEEEMRQKAEASAAKQYAATLLDGLSVCTANDSGSVTDPARKLEALKVIWADAAAAEASEIPMDYAVLLSDREDLVMSELKNAGTYLYCSPEHADFSGYMKIQYYTENYETETDPYERMLNEPWIIRWTVPTQDQPLDKPYYLYVMYSTGSADTGTSCLTADELTFLSVLHSVDRSGVLFPIPLLLCLVSLILFCKNSGYRNGEQELRLERTDRIPFLFFFGAVSVCELMLMGILGGFLSTDGILEMFGFHELATIICTMLFAILLVGFVLLSTLCARLKTRMFIRTTLAYHCGRWVKDHIYRAGSWAAAHVPLAVRLLVALPFVGIISVVEAALIEDASGPAAFLFILARIWALAAIVYLVWGYSKLRDGAAAMAEGKTRPVEEKGLIPEYRLFAGYLNGVGRSIQVAVDERMKSERLKTQLITNVSHDIKTPLTSIINYVDLLQRENASEEERKEYLEILAHQSDRLKKLIQDLIDASKASSGAVEVTLAKTDLSTLAGQVCGEYQDKMERAGLTTVTRKLEEGIMVSADGNLLWRVMDNLFANVLKYAMTGTRVYIETGERDGMVTLGISNISGTELGVSGEELMERFVRGDQSRSTEGSGLGLSIAKSLMELMEGDLAIRVDGDMFKAILTLKRWDDRKEDRKEEENSTVIALPET